MNCKFPATNIEEADKDKNLFRWAYQDLKLSKQLKRPIFRLFVEHESDQIESQYTRLGQIRPGNGYLSGGPITII